MRCLLYSSLLVIVCLAAVSCARGSYPTQTGDRGVVAIGTDVKKFDLNLNFGKKHFNGMIAIRRMDAGEIRIVGYTPFGLSLFDFGLTDKNFTVHSCIEPMRNKKLLRLLEQDFNLLFLSTGKAKQVEIRDNYSKFADGRFFTKRTASCTNDTLTGKQHIVIKRPWLKLSIELDELKEKHVVE